MPHLPITNIQGLIPLIDPRRIPDPHIVNGRNFYLDADGPKSGFSRRIVQENLFAFCDCVQSIRVDRRSEVYYMTSAGVFEWDSSTRALFAHYLFEPQLQTRAPWTFAICGGKEYFARRGVGLLERDPATDVWRQPPIVGVEDIIAITQSGGRLITISFNVAAWSAIDDGTDFTPSLNTGAGSQSLSPLATESADQIFTVFEYELGFIVYTALGVMRFELVDATIPFRFRVLSRDFAPINQWCAIKLKDYEHVFLDIRGLYSTRGLEPEPWQPLMSEYLHSTLLPTLDLTIDTIVRLWTDDDRSWFIIGVANTAQVTLYTDSLVLYLPSDQWGRLNRAHAGIVSIHYDEGSGFFETGYLDANGSMWQFTDATIDELPPTLRPDFVLDWSELHEWPPRRESPTKAVFVGVCRFTSYRSVLITSPGYWNERRVMESVQSPIGPADLDRPATPGTPGGDPVLWDSGIIWDEFVWDSVAGGSPAKFIAMANMGCILRVTQFAIARYGEGGLDSWIRVGSFRGGVDMDADELSFIHEIGVGSLDAGIGDEFEDYIADYSDGDLLVDWETIAEGAEDEDWGFETSSPTTYQIKSLGTLDGHKVWEDQEKVPTEEQADGSYRLFSTYVTGIYHLIELQAFEVGETFHIKTMDLGVEPAGRLT